MRKTLFQLCISVILLGFFAIQVDWTELLSSFKEINLAFYLASTMAALSGPVILAGKYRLLIKRSNLALPFRRLVTVNFIVRFYALFLPSALGPEAVRWYKITKNKQGKAFFLAATIFERIFFILVLFMCAAFPLFFIPDPAVRKIASRIRPFMVFATVGFAFTLAYFLWPALQIKVKTFFFWAFKLSPQSRLHEFIDNFSLKNLSVEIINGLFLYTLVWQSAFLLRIYFLFLSLDLPFAFLDAVWMGSIVMLLQVIPVSFAGLGVREGAYSFLFSLQGVATELGGLVGLLFFSQMLIFSLIGWILEVSGKDR